MTKNTIRLFTILAFMAFVGFGCTKTVSEQTTTAVDTDAEQVVENTAEDTSMDKTNTNTTEPMQANAEDAEYDVIVDESTIVWTGYKIIPKGTHVGTINFDSGMVTVDESGMITSGTFVVDMDSIVNNDVESEDMNARLVTHLKSDDFFAVETYPTATLEITNIATLENREDGMTHQIAANLTMKGTTHNVTFPAKVTMQDGIINASATVTFDRTLWDIRFGSLKFGPDAIVEDMVTFEVSVVAELQ